MASLEGLGLQAPSWLVSAKSGGCRAFRVPQRQEGEAAGGAAPRCARPAASRVLRFADAVRTRRGGRTVTFLELFRRGSSAAALSVTPSRHPGGDRRVSLGAPRLPVGGVVDITGRRGDAPGHPVLPLESVGRPRRRPPVPRRGHMKAALLPSTTRTGSSATCPTRAIEGPDDVIVRVGAAGFCRTDIHIWDGQFDEAWKAAGMALPFVCGHENAGWIEAVGDGVKHLSVGDGGAAARDGDLRLLPRLPGRRRRALHRTASSPGSSPPAASPSTCAPTPAPASRCPRA